MSVLLPVMIVCSELIGEKKREYATLFRDIIAICLNLAGDVYRCYLILCLGSCFKFASTITGVRGDSRAGLAKQRLLDLNARRVSVRVWGFATGRASAVTRRMRIQTK